MKLILKLQFDFCLKGSFILVSLVIISSTLSAQSFDVGHTSMVFYDSVRNRNIPTEIYYPADTPGENVPVSTGNFPVLVFGHGFLMGWNAYQNFWTELVPNGYVICFPTTEMGITPNHQNFGNDLRFLATQMQRETQSSTSLFFHSLAQETGIMGHSMGGGASFLAAENNSTIHALINFAAAETNPSAIAAAQNITVPSLMFSGDDDCVTPPGDNQNIMYDGLASSCKTHITIINGGHCYFAEDNFACNLGESFCNPTLNITREEQQSVTRDFLTIWLDYSLKGNLNAFTVFNDSLQHSSRIHFSQSCTTTRIQGVASKGDLKFFPNPVMDNLMVTMPKEKTGGFLSIYTLMGKQVYQKQITRTPFPINLSNLAKGTYCIIYSKDLFSYSSTLIRI